MLKFFVGFFVGALLILLIPFLYAWSGAMPVATNAPPLPFEKRLVRMAMRAALKNEANRPSPVPPGEEAYLAGAKVYRANCAVCHGVPGSGATAIAKGMFPPPPQLFEDREMVTDDPIGKVYWKIRNGIRLTGMPGFVGSLSETEIWQLSQLLVHADAISPQVKSALRP